MKGIHFRIGGFLPGGNNEIWFVLSGDINGDLYAVNGKGRVACAPYPEFPTDYYTKNYMEDSAECYAYRAQLSDYDESKDVVITDERNRTIHKFNAEEKSLLPYGIDMIEEKEKSVYVSGWCMSDSDFSVKLSDFSREILVRRIHRYDVNKCYPLMDYETESGFEIRIDKDGGRVFPFTIVLSDGNYTANCTVTETDLNRYRDEGLWKYVNKTKRAFEVLSQDGLSAVIKKTRRYFVDENSYEEWIKTHEPTRAELQKQSLMAADFAKQPKISIVIPVYRTRKSHLLELIDCVRNQTYPNWELCLADAGADENGRSILEPVVRKEAEADSRIKYEILKENKSIAENTNEAIKMATGDYIGFCDHDDTLSLEALFSCVEVINEHDDCDVIYSDQDFIDESGKKRSEPLMKPDFSIDFLRCTNYISHFFVVKRELIEQVGMLDVAYDGSQDYDFTFRCVEKARGIYHIPKILYHWRIVGTSTADDPGTKTYAYNAGKRAIDAHFKRCNIPAEAEITEYYGKYRIHYHWDSKPLVSILIPNKDHTDILDTCVSSILDRLTYDNYEMIIIENNSELPETFEYYKQLEERSDKVRVIYYDGDFNYSKINNFGASQAKGEYLWLLNNDTEIINEDFLDEMMGYAQREDVGIVGARLFYEDRTIQHAGVIMGYCRLAGHAFLGFKDSDYGMLGRIVSAQNYSAVTAACLLTRKSVYEEVGGLSEEFVVAFNDIDYCMKVRSTGKLVVYTPFAKAFHYESKSRGYEDTPEKKARFAKECALLRERWSDIIYGQDPYYNPNLTLDAADFALRKD